MKTKYPKSNGKEWDSIRKRKFDALRKEFKNTIQVTKKGYGLSSKDIETIAWNCAFVVVTS